MQSNHAGLVAALRDEGVEVVDGGPMPPRLMNAVYARDPMCVVRGGAVIGRMGPLMRRGEERYATQAVAALGMPILRTICGTGMLEGGTVVKLTPRVYAFGASIRCNPEGARQLAEVLVPLGVELIVVPLVGWSIHLDGHLSMIDRDKALCDRRHLPYWFIERLGELGIELIEVPEDESWAINGLAVRPGRVILSEGQPRTVERLGAHGVEVVEIPYGEIQRGGGGIHCTTMELRRERA
jgi:N-dimethylarginine dimethylaminohydrolase